MSSFTKNIAITFSSRFLAAVFTVLSTILIARAFGPIGKGIFTMVAFMPALALNMGHLGLGNANTYLISQDKSKSKNAFSNSFWLGLYLGLFFIIIFASLYRFYPQLLMGKGDFGNRFFILSLFTIPFILWENLFQGIFVGKQEFKFFNIVTLFDKFLLFIGLVILLFFLRIDIKWAVYYYVILMILPSTPICNPGLESIKAALNPLPNQSWYYLTDRKTGKTIFSKTYEEHSQARRKYL